MTFEEAVGRARFGSRLYGVKAWARKVGERWEWGLTEAPRLAPPSPPLVQVVPIPFGESLRRIDEGEVGFAIFSDEVAWDGLPLFEWWVSPAPEST